MVKHLLTELNEEHPFQPPSSPRKPAPPDFSRLEDFAKAAGWTRESGSIVGVFDEDSSKPIGHKCIWGCTWSTSRGQITADMLLPLDHASQNQLIAELNDLVGEGRDCLRIEEARRILPLLEDGKCGAGISEARQLLRKVRPGYRHYLTPWDMPTNDIYMYIWRPGWR
jgi:hypothetical protein